MSRYERWKIKVAGVCPVPVDGIENINLSHIVEKHTDYCTKMKEILEEIHVTAPFAPVNSITGVTELTHEALISTEELPATTATLEGMQKSLTLNENVDVIIGEEEK